MKISDSTIEEVKAREGEAMADGPSNPTLIHHGGFTIGVRQYTGGYLEMMGGPKITHSDVDPYRPRCYSGGRTSAQEVLLIGSTPRSTSTDRRGIFTAWPPTQRQVLQAQCPFCSPKRTGTAPIHGALSKLCGGR